MRQVTREQQRLTALSMGGGHAVFVGSSSCTSGNHAWLATALTATVVERARRPC